MIAKEVKRRTEKVHVDMSEVIVNGGPLAAVARGVQDVNETLATHAAWTEERFDKVEERLASLDNGQQAIRQDLSGLSGKVDGLGVRIGNLEASHVAMHAEIARMEDRLGNRIDRLGNRIDRVETRMDRMETRVIGEIDKLAVRMDKVISFAIKDELKAGEVSGETKQ